MHLRLGQAARHDAQDQTSWPSQRRYRLHAQSDRLQLDPHSQTAGGVGQRLLTTSRPPQTPRQKDGQCTNLQVLQQTARGDCAMASGTVKWFNPAKGYGFIQPQGGGKDVFVHISALEKAGLSNLNEGQVIEYEEVANKGKTSAENLKVQR